MTTREAIAVYRREKALSEQRNCLQLLIEQAVISEAWLQQQARTPNPFRNYPKPKVVKPARRWTPNGQLAEGSSHE